MRGGRVQTKNITLRKVGGCSNPGGEGHGEKFYNGEEKKASLR